MNQKEREDEIKIEKTEASSVTLKKIIYDNISHSLNNKILFGLILLLVIFRIILWFVLPHYFLHVHSDEYCPNPMPQNYDGHCETVTISDTKVW